ncbi:MAG: monovalent cation/H(+) antiporter subunit G, partial [Deltaproteobacteria bacterium]|nr:monovalent cation/H(+) antiporter subunit G [Deltaproteobacteria bacterium]
MTIIITIMLITGLIFFAGGSIGIIRFPDFYSRLHPAGKLDTGGLVITMSALALYT